MRIIWTVLLVALLVGCHQPSQEGHAPLEAAAHQSLAAEQAQIKAVIKQHFDCLYEEQATGQRKEYRHLIADSHAGQAFFEREEKKRLVERYQANLYNLRYASYGYRLEYELIDLHQPGTAEVYLKEHNWTRSADAPEVESRLFGLEHVIVLKRSKQQQWKIEQDDYETITTKVLDQGEPIELLKARIKRHYDADQLEETKPTAKRQLWESDPKAAWWHWRPQRTIQYAQRWAESMNPRYASFSKMGGDCTNFVSQAIRAGGNRSDYEGRSSRLKWYYRTINDRAPSWTGVDELHAYLLRSPGNGEMTQGPVGYEVPKADAKPGDVIQMKWSLLPGYNHTVIITKIKNGNIYYSGHSAPRLDYDLRKVKNVDRFRFIALAVLG